MQVVIVGAGGHAQVVADILLRMRDAGEPVVPIGYVDDDPALTSEVRLGLPVLGTTADLDAIAHDAIVVGVGDASTRKDLYTSLRMRGERFEVARHPSAVIGEGVQVGDGTMICANVVVNPGSVIGSNVILNTSCTVDHHNRIGAHAHVAPGAHLGGDVTVGEGALIGIGATVLPQRRVGAWCTVGAGALVNKDLADGVMVIGVPARRVSQSARRSGKKL